MNTLDENAAPDPVTESDGPGPDQVRRGPSGAALISFVIALMFLAGVIGWKIGERRDDVPTRNSVDVGFFQDMSTHHNQVISMAFTYLANGTDPLLRQIAGEIITYQASEIGVMGDHLTQWAQAGTETDTAMAWMGMVTPRDQMLGLATKAELRTLATARGAELNNVFSELVIKHHAGGVHMAEYAAKHAHTAAVKRWATSMADGQLGEIAELNRWRVKNGLAAVPVKV